MADNLVEVGLTASIVNSTPGIVDDRSQRKLNLYAEVGSWNWIRVATVKTKQTLGIIDVLLDDFFQSRK